MTDISEKIDSIKDKFGKKLVVLGHHYQRSRVIRYADFTGDSLELARKAADCPDAERIVFCGVRFMAETARVLARPEQKVYMPEMSADCPMARMADVERAQRAWDRIEAVVPEWLPVVYVNSTADVKAFCGSKGGSACTSSNARKIFEWVFSQGKRIFFLPDEHLGANTAKDLGIDPDQIRVYDWRRENGGLSDQEIASAKVILWKGFCLVHTAFTADQIRSVRETLPGAKIIVHPEVPEPVASLADAKGSTSQIIKYVESVPDGSTVVVGTELNLVERLAELYHERITVKALSQSVCSNMSKTNEKNLLLLLENWPESSEVSVDDAIAGDARVCIERMLSA